MPNRKIIQPLVIFLFALLLLFVLWQALSAGPNPTPAPAAAFANVVTPEPIETATPLPTLSVSESGDSSNAFLLFGGVLLLAMVFLMVAGIGAAILLVKLRNKFD